jgi:hypothetical protein
MSQGTARHQPQAKSRDEDVDDMGPRRPEHKEGPLTRQPAGRPASAGQPAGDVGPDGPEDDGLELIGDDDLGAADLGPLGPHADPDAGSGRIRKIAGEDERGRRG